MALVLPTLSALALAGPGLHPSPNSALRLRPALAVEAQSAQQLPLLAAAYKLSGATTCAAWAACSWVSMARVPFAIPLVAVPSLHDTLCVASALAPLPLIWAYFSALASASMLGWRQLRQLTCRRLNHALAMATKASLLGVLFAPAATQGIVSYASPLLYMLLASYGSAALLSTAVHARSLKPDGAWTLNPLVQCAAATDAQVAMLCNLMPAAPSGEPAAGGAPKYAVLTIAFVILTALQLGSFPLATVPSFLGARLARGYAPWTLLAAVACHALKDAADRGQLATATSTKLRLGLQRYAVWHLALAALKMAIDSPARYPAALACSAWSVASLIAFALVLRPDGEMGAAT